MPMQLKRRITAAIQEHSEDGIIKVLYGEQGEKESKDKRNVI